MRKLATAGIAAALIISMHGGGAAAAKKAARQEVAGSIATPMAVPVENVCNTGAHRRTTHLSDGAMPDGVVGYDFEVDPKTVNKPFVLTTDDPAADFDITFYTAVGNDDDPTVNPQYIDFETRAKGGEGGTVPKGYGYAFVCLYEGQNSNFQYVAGKGVKAP